MIPGCRSQTLRVNYNNKIIGVIDYSDNRVTQLYLTGLLFRISAVV